MRACLLLPGRSFFAVDEENPEEEEGQEGQDVEGTMRGDAASGAGSGSSSSSSDRQLARSEELIWVLRASPIKRRGSLGIASASAD